MTQHGRSEMTALSARTGLPRLPHCLRAGIGLLLTAVASAALAETQVRMMETDPPLPATLGRDQPIYLRITYTADEPIRIWIRPYFQGKPLAHTRSNASSEHTGSGEALGWFSLDDASQVDEIRVVVGGGKPHAERLLAQIPVQITGTGEALTSRVPEASWVTALQHADEQRTRAVREKARNEPASVLDRLIMPIFMLVVVGLITGGLAAPAWSLWKWRGSWRAAAALPALIMLFVIGRIVVDTARDPTSHNLWPFEILIYGIPSVAIMAALALARRWRKSTP